MTFCVWTCLCWTQQESKWCQCQHMMILQYFLGWLYYRSLSFNSPWSYSQWKYNTFHMIYNLQMNFHFFKWILAFCFLSNYWKQWPPLIQLKMAMPFRKERAEIKLSVIFPDTEGLQAFWGCLMIASNQMTGRVMCYSTICLLRRFPSRWK